MFKRSLFVTVALIVALTGLLSACSNSFGISPVVSATQALGLNFEATMSPDIGTLVQSPTISPTLAPTDTPEPSPTATSEPLRLNGIVFFDLNKSGKLDEVMSLPYNRQALTSSSQINLRYHPAIIKMWTDYLESNPIEPKNGDMFPMMEPRLEGFNVCVADSCSTTNAKGEFSLLLPPTKKLGGWTLFQVTNLPYSEDEEYYLKMRYIIPNNPKIIEAKTIIYDGKTVFVPEQHLNCGIETKIESGITFPLQQEPIEIGLTQGPGLWPPVDAPVKIPHFFSASHVGVDFDAPKGNWIYAPISGRVVFSSKNPNTVPGMGPANAVDIVHSQIGYNTEEGHNDTNLVKERQQVCSGQTVATIGNTGTVTNHLHLNVTEPYDMHLNPFGDMNIKPPFFSACVTNNTSVCVAFGDKNIKYPFFWVTYIPPQIYQH